MPLLTSDNPEDHPSRCGNVTRSESSQHAGMTVGSVSAPSVHRARAFPGKMKTRGEQIIIELWQRKGEFALYLANWGLIIFTL